MKLHKIFLFLLFFASAIVAQNSALSMHLAGKDNFSGDIIMKTLKIPHKTLYTYYCALMWNVGGEAGGYCGLQNHPSGNNFIFSIWDPKSSNKPIKAVYTGAGTKVENFGGEGTGLKSWNFKLGWAEGNDYQVVARRWDVDKHTHFGYWVHDISSNNWTHLVTMDFPVAHIKFNTTTGSFLEDWSSSGNNMRKVFQKDGYKRKTNGTWVPFNEMHYSINTYDIRAEGRSYNYRKNYDAGIEDGYYYMQSGGATTPSFSGTSIDLTNNFPSEPQNLPIDFFITGVSESELSWTVPQSCTPQYKIIAKMGSTILVDSIITDETKVKINATTGKLIRVTIEDILGNLVTKKVSVGTNKLVPKVPTGLKVDEFGSSSFSISWDSNNKAELYKVQIQDSLIWKEVDNTQLTSYTFSNLKSRSRYRARVAATNSFGTSAYSDFVFALTTVNNETIISNKNWELKYVDSEETTGENGFAVNAFDGDEKTFWHTEWSSNEPKHPHEIQIALGANYKVKGFKYLPRQDGGMNGTIAKYEFYVSTDGENWGEAISNGTFETNTKIKEIDFAPIECRFVKLKAISEVNGGAWSSMAELILVGSLIVDVNNSESNLPAKFNLNEAYPNPFNPSTTISFGIPKMSEINISIYDSIGKLVSELVDGEVNAGLHEVVWNAQNFASGIYYCKFIAPSFSETKKIILLK